MSEDYLVEPPPPPPPHHEMEIHHISLNNMNIDYQTKRNKDVNFFCILSIMRVMYMYVFIVMMMIIITLTTSIL